MSEYANSAHIESGRLCVQYYKGADIVARERDQVICSRESSIVHFYTIYQLDSYLLPPYDTLLLCRPCGLLDS